MENTNKQAVLSLSGGMDSSTVLLRLLADGYEVTALSFDYGQKHKVELERAQSLIDYLGIYNSLDSKFIDQVVFSNNNIDFSKHKAKN